MKKQAPRKAARSSRSRLITWIAAAAIVGAVVFGLSQVSNVAYTDKDIGVVDFSSLDARQKRSALEAANQARCNCGCGMTLAQCVATDSTCPVRDANIDRIKVMVREAARPTS
jgi:hypothetical protein